MEKSRGVHTVGVDEMTGMQALERNAPTKPLIAGKRALIEFEYTRNGTLCLIANMVVTTGEWLRPTIGPPRTAADFASHIEQTVATDLEGSWLFVVDNLNIHCSESLVELVAEACEIPPDLGKKGVRGVLKSVASREKFLSEEGHRIRFVYTPKPSSWLNPIESIFGVIMRKVIPSGVVPLGRRLAHEVVELYRVLQSCVRQAVPLDVHGSPADEGSSVKLGKQATQGIFLPSFVFNCEKSV
ncbi:hypothetical protein BH23PLA1_BH23PLA1_19600 [soil metagenome]